MEGAFRISKNAIATCLRKGIVRQKLYRAAAGKMGKTNQINSNPFCNASDGVFLFCTGERAEPG